MITIKIGKRDDTPAEEPKPVDLPGTEVCLENKREQNTANIYLSGHVDEYPDFVMIGSTRYWLVDRGEGQRLAIYRINDDKDLQTLGNVHKLPANHPTQRARRRNDK